MTDIRIQLEQIVNGTRRRISSLNDLRRWVRANNFNIVCDNLTYLIIDVAGRDSNVWLDNLPFGRSCDRFAAQALLDDLELRGV
jgi:hypothetical protein